MKIVNNILFQVRDLHHARGSSMIETVTNSVRSTFPLMLESLVARPNNHLGIDFVFVVLVGERVS